MNEQWVIEHATVLVFAAVGLVAATFPFVVAALLAPRDKYKQTDNTYECGMDPIGPAWTRYGVLYYMYALMFLAFDVDVLYLFPAALAYRDPSIPPYQAMFEVVLFISILSLAIAFAWKKGVFTWAQKIKDPS